MLVIKILNFFFNNFSSRYEFTLEKKCLYNLDLFIIFTFYKNLNIEKVFY
jgi:hypothetical protein